MSEFNIIKKYFAPLAAKESGALNLTDDAAIMRVPEGFELVVTKDAIVEGVHFIGDEPPALIAGKLLRVNLSDLAAMGAKPYACFLALMLPEQISETWLEAFAEGLRNDQENFAITLMGGDTTRTPGTLSLSLTALGFVPRGEAIRRSGARAGDNIYVTGTIGDAALGLQVAKGVFRDNTLLQRYRLPSPRLEIGQEIRGIATACIDISDGLMQDLGHIVECSNVGAVIHWELIPLSDAAKAAMQKVNDSRETILAGGDDYELLFTAPPETHARLQEIARNSAVNITHIGSIKEKGKVKIIDKNGNDITLSRNGYNHFKKNP